MNRKTILWVGIVAGGGMLFVLMISLLASPSELSWHPTWAGKDKNPFGAGVLKEAVQDFIHPAEIVTVSSSPLDQEELYWEYNTAYFSVNQIFDPTDDELALLQEFAYNGNLVLIAASQISENVSEELGLSVYPPGSDAVISGSSDSLQLFFQKSGWTERRWNVPKRYVGQIVPGNFEGVNVEPVMMNEYGDIVAAYLPYEEGGFLIFSCPKLLTNYGLVHPAFSGLVPGLISFLPEWLDTLYWDEWIKVGNNRREDDRAEEGDSALSFIWKNESLRMAFLVGLLSLVLVAAFQVKRVQRLIPPEDVLPNTTLEFTQTVGRLYLQSQQHLHPARKRISAFREYLGRRYFLPSDWKAEPFIPTLAAKSGLGEEQIRRLVKTILYIETAAAISEEQLLAVSQMIDDFYAHQETPST